MVERATHNRVVGGSSPPGTTTSEPLLDAIRRSALVTATGRILAAVSGGPDSTALLVALREIGHDVVAAHYDHALQPASAGVAQQVGALCARLGVELLEERRRQPLPAGSVQAAARQLRYDFLARAAERAGAETVALAHTADDVVEGVVLHLLRGCGLAGLRGMPPRRGAYVRPMLGVWRREIDEFLAGRGIAAHDDPANSNLSFARVRVREQIIPALERDLPGIRKRLLSVALNAVRWHDSVRRQAEAALASGPPVAAALESMPEPVAAEVLVLLYVRGGGSEPGLAETHLDAMLAVARSRRGGRGVDLPGALRFRSVDGLLEVVPRVRGTEAYRLDVRPCDGCGAPNAMHLRSSNLAVGGRRPGLRLRPLGGRGTRKLQDVFVDAKVPREERDGWPLVFADGELAWVPGIAVDERAASREGEAGFHAELSPLPVPFRRKVGRLGASDRPSRRA